MAGKALLVVRKEVQGVSGRLVIVDPGTKETGWAVFEGRTLGRSGECKGEDLFKVLPLSGVVGLVIERPMFFGGRPEVASSIGTLYRLEGLVVGRALGLGWRVWELTPAEWKGQLPKSVTQRKVRGLFPGRLWVGDDEMDAVALGARVLNIW